MTEGILLGVGVADGADVVAVAVADWVVVGVSVATAVWVVVGMVVEVGVKVSSGVAEA